MRPQHPEAEIGRDRLLVLAHRIDEAPSLAGIDDAPDEQRQQTGHKRECSQPQHETKEGPVLGRSTRRLHQHPLARRNGDETRRALGA